MSDNYNRKENIPSWDGRPESWEQHLIELEIFCLQAPSCKESQQIAKVLGNLKDEPKRLYSSLSEVERRKITSRAAYVQYIKGHLLESAIPELGRHFRAWIRVKRENKEGMRLFVLRRRQTLSKVERSLQESSTSKKLNDKLRTIIDGEKMKIVMDERAASLRSARTSYSSKSVHKDFRTKAPTTQQPRQWRSPAARAATAADPEDSEEYEEEWGNATWTDEAPWEKDEEEGGAEDTKSNWSDGQWTWKSEQWKWRTSKSETKEPEVVKDKLAELGECIAQIELELQVSKKEDMGKKLTELIAAKWRESFMPDTLLGYHLLHAAGLTATERSTILSSTNALTLQGTLMPQALLAQIPLV